MFYLAVFSLLGFISCEKMSHQTAKRKEGVPVVGGQIARIEDFPYSAFVDIMCAVGEYYAAYMCGASIVNDRIAMTAAHCLADCGPRSKVSISVGKNTFGGQLAWVHKFLIHKSFTTVPTVINDIALMKLKPSLQFGKKVKRVALMPDPPYFEKARVAGWGLINEETLEDSPYLQYVNQYVRKTKECLKVISNMPKGTLCASSRKETSYASRGDSGSALVVRGYIQIGIVSYKIPTISRSLVVYTDTGYFYDWITHNTKRLYCS